SPTHIHWLAAGRPQRATTRAKAQNLRNFLRNRPHAANSLFGALWGVAAQIGLNCRLFSTARHFELWRAVGVVIHSPLYHSQLTTRILPFMSEVTRILSAIEAGDRQAAEQLLPLVYDELRKLAAARLAHEKPGQTLVATALVHEAYIRLVE